MKIIVKTLIVAGLLSMPCLAYLIALKTDEAVSELRCIEICHDKILKEMRVHEKFYRLNSNVEHFEKLDAIHEQIIKEIR